MRTERPAALNGSPIYLDYNGTTPVDPAVATAMQPYLTTHFGNPSSDNAFGRFARAGVASARKQVGDLLGVSPDDMVFTGSGSEGNTLAIRGVALASGARGGHIVTQMTEHPSVLNVCGALERLHDFRVTYLPVDEYGQVSVRDLEAALDDDTVLVSIMYANNETGTVQPVRELAQVAHDRGVPFHADASQAVGKVPVDVADLGVDLLTVAGHKLYAPKGVGALYVSPRIRLEPSTYGGGQERQRRAGTENVAFIAGLGAAAVLAGQRLPADRAAMRRTRDRLWNRLVEAVPELITLNGHPLERLPNTLNVSFEGVEASRLLNVALNLAASAGSACHAGSAEPSEVLTAMGISRSRALGAVRLTTGRWTTDAEVDRAADILVATVGRLDQAA